MIGLTVQIEGKELKLMVNAKKPFMKAMKTLAVKFKKNLSNVVFRNLRSGLLLTGKESMEKLEGATISMEM